MRNVTMMRFFCIYLIGFAGMAAIAHYINPTLTPTVMAVYFAPSVIALLAFIAAISLITLLNIPQVAIYLIACISSAAITIILGLVTLGFGAARAASANRRRTTAAAAYMKRTAFFPPWLRAWRNFALKGMFLFLVWPYLAVLGVASFFRPDHKLGVSPQPNESL